MYSFTVSPYKVIYELTVNDFDKLYINNNNDDDGDDDDDDVDST